MDLNRLKEWAAAKSTRYVEIKIQTPMSTREFEVKVWVYDRELSTGQYVENMHEINLEEKRIEQARRDLDEATRKIQEYERQKSQAQSIIEKGEPHELRETE